MFTPPPQTFSIPPQFQIPRKKTSTDIETNETSGEKKTKGLFHEMFLSYFFIYSPNLAEVWLRPMFFLNFL